MANDRNKAPWADFRGAEIFEGDTIIHPTGETGKVVFLPAEENEGDAWRVDYGTAELSWRVDYGTAELSRLCLQIGDKGQAYVLATKEASNG